MAAKTLILNFDNVVRKSKKAISPQIIELLNSQKSSIINAVVQDKHSLQAIADSINLQIEKSNSFTKESITYPKPTGESEPVFDKEGQPVLLKNGEQKVKYLKSSVTENRIPKVSPNHIKKLIAKNTL